MLQHNLSKVPFQKKKILSKVVKISAMASLIYIDFAALESILSHNLLFDKVLNILKNSTKNQNS